MRGDRATLLDGRLAFEAAREAGIHAPGMLEFQGIKDSDRSLHHKPDAPVAVVDIGSNSGPTWWVPSARAAA